MRANNADIERQTDTDGCVGKQRKKKERTIEPTRASCAFQSGRSAPRLMPCMVHTAALPASSSLTRKSPFGAWFPLTLTLSPASPSLSLSLSEPPPPPPWRRRRAPVPSSLPSDVCDNQHVMPCHAISCLSGKSTERTLQTHIVLCILSRTRPIQIPAFFFYYLAPDSECVCDISYFVAEGGPTDATGGPACHRDKTRQSTK